MLLQFQREIVESVLLSGQSRDPPGHPHHPAAGRQEDALIVVGKGLGREALLLHLIHVHSTPHHQSLVLLLNTAPDEVHYLHQEIAHRQLAESKSDPTAASLSVSASATTTHDDHPTTSHQPLRILNAETTQKDRYIHY